MTSQRFKLLLPYIIININLENNQLRCTVSCDLSNARSMGYKKGSILTPCGDTATV